MLDIFAQEWEHSLVSVIDTHRTNLSSRRSAGIALTRVPTKSLEDFFFMPIRNKRLGGNAQ